MTGEDWDEERLEAALFGGPPRARPAVLPMPDFAELHQQWQLHPHLTQFPIRETGFHTFVLRLGSVEFIGTDTRLDLCVGGSRSPASYITLSLGLLRAPEDAYDRGDMPTDSLG